MYWARRVRFRVARSWPTRPAACQVVPHVSFSALEQQHVAAAALGQVVGDAAADDAAADDHHARVGGKIHRHAQLTCA